MPTVSGNLQIPDHCIRISFRDESCTPEMTFSGQINFYLRDTKWLMAL